jgi:hypothetical protein
MRDEPQRRPESANGLVFVDRFALKVGIGFGDGNGRDGRSGSNACDLSDGHAMAKRRRVRRPMMRAPASGGLRAGLPSPDMSSAQLAHQTFMPPAADYPLRTGRADSLARRDILWLGALCLIALLPRALIAYDLGPVCDDGYFYLAVADAYERGDFHTALWYLNINIYPVLIAGFDRLGADPLVAAKIWGVAVSTLAILPLFGWLRRLLDRRVALAACGLYAIHTEFIEVSPEPIRDSTFWLLAATSLYLLWRAAAEQRLWLFASAGLAVAAAAHTRSEGWLLMLPAAGWPLIRWRESLGSRWKLSIGTATAFAMTPLFVILFNVTVLRHHDQWELGKLEHFRLAARWAVGAVDSEAPSGQVAVPPAFTGATTIATTTNATTDLAAAAAAMSEKAAQAHPRRRGGAMMYFRAAAHALEPVPLVLMLIGAVFWPHLLLRREHLVLSAICVAVLAGVWMRQVTLGEINGRYFLACFFPASGAAGLGTLWTLTQLERGWTAFGRRRGAAAAATVAIAVGAAHVADAVAAEHPSRERDAAIGRHLAEQLGPHRSFLVLPHACRVGYYASGRLPVVALDDTPLEKLLERHHADTVILERDYTPADQCAALADQLETSGWRPLELAGECDAAKFVVLTRPVSVAKAIPTRAQHSDVR